MYSGSGSELGYEWEFDSSSDYAAIFGSALDSAMDFDSTKFGFAIDYVSTNVGRFYPTISRLAMDSSQSQYNTYTNTVTLDNPFDSDPIHHNYSIG